MCKRGGAVYHFSFGRFWVFVLLSVFGEEQTFVLLPTLEEITQSCHLHVGKSGINSESDRTIRAPHKLPRQEDLESYQIHNCRMYKSKPHHTVVFEGQQMTLALPGLRPRYPLERHCHILCWKLEVRREVTEP